MQTATDYYAVLRLKPRASLDEVRRQYRRLAKIYHPDRNPGEEEWCAEQLSLVNDAYKFLSDPAKKAAYDRDLGSDPRATQGTTPRAASSRAPAMQSASPPPLSPWRIAATLFGGVACIVLAAVLTTVVFAITHPGGISRITLPSLSMTQPPAQTPEYHPPQPLHSEHRRRRRAYPTASYLSSTGDSVSRERERLAGLGVQTPAGGFSAAELREMANRVQQYDATH
jgi:curved DNA-binding protein CbpA